AVEWDRAIRPHRPDYVQPVRIELPSVGLVVFYDGSADRNVLTQAPSQVGMLVGRTYRFQITGMPEYPGASLYPTIELLDRLHPPAGREQDFPIPIPFSPEEIESALDDQLVTKVIYLEQPQWAAPLEPGQPIHVDDLPPDANLMQAADRRGRAMAIVRLGGRIPAVRGGGNSQFYGDLAPVITHMINRPAAAPVPAFELPAPIRRAASQPESSAVKTRLPAIVSVSE
ncbi:MAG: hypothetical protein AB7U20_20840, partial [Planctomycetaceae bacterium]